MEKLELVLEWNFQEVVQMTTIEFKYVIIIDVIEKNYIVKWFQIVIFLNSHSKI